MNNHKETFSLFAMVKKLLEIISVKSIEKPFVYRFVSGGVTICITVVDAIFASILLAYLLMIQLPLAEGNAETSLYAKMLSNFLLKRCDSRLIKYLAVHDVCVTRDSHLSRTLVLFCSI